MTAHQANPEDRAEKDLRLYTIKEVAKILNLSITWLYERTRKQEIPCHRFGKYIRFTESDLRNIITMGNSTPSGNGSSDTSLL
jgi:excisionase family DNA binding protein